MVVCKASGAVEEVLKYLQRFPLRLGNMCCDRDPCYRQSVCDTCDTLAVTGKLTKLIHYVFHSKTQKPKVVQRGLEGSCRTQDRHLMFGTWFTN